MDSKWMWIGLLTVVSVFSRFIPACAQTGGISGSIVLGDSSHCANCEVTIDPMVGTSGAARTTRTDRQGRFLYVGLQPGKYFLAVTDPVTHAVKGELISVNAGSPMALNIDFSRGISPQGDGELVGSVQLDGHPCSACTVLIKPTGSTFGTETDSGCNFRYHLPAGEYTFTVQLPDGGPSNRTMRVVSPSLSVRSTPAM